MFGKAKTGASAYSTVGVETGVSAASPHRLIVMLFDGALITLTIAHQQMKGGDVAAKGQAISKAIDIIENGLRASLNKDEGGQIADNLDALYEYMSSQLLLANVRNDVMLLEEVQKLLKGLKEAWESIDPLKPQGQAAVIVPKPQPYDALTPRDYHYAKA